MRAMRTKSDRVNGRRRPAGWRVARGVGSLEPVELRPRVGDAVHVGVALDAALARLGICLDGGAADGKGGER